MLSEEYGPRVVDAVLDSDFAVLLRDQRGAPVSAASVDVYGRDVVVMDLAATAEEARGRGHFRCDSTAVRCLLSTEGMASKSASEPANATNICFSLEPCSTLGPQTPTPSKSLHQSPPVLPFTKAHLSFLGFSSRSPSPERAPIAFNCRT